MDQGASVKFDVIIGGGSFVGLALACGLAKSAPGALRIAVIERIPAAQLREGRYDARAVALTAAAKNMLQALGVWDEIAPQAQAVTAIDITDTMLEIPIRSVLLNFQSVLEGEEPAAHILENAILRRALFAAAEALPDISIISPDSVSGIAFGAPMVTADLASGGQLQGSLLIAADGQRSALRHMAGFKIVEWTSDQAALVGTVAHEKPHGGRAVQHFLPSGPFAILPMTGNRCSLVWTEEAREAQRIAKLPTADAVYEIERRMGGKYGELSLAGALSCFPLSMTMARSFVKPRMALAGDAAHGLHWIAGQGLNHGLKDAAALTEVLVDALRLGLDIGDLTVLQRYERWRRFDSASSAMSAAMLNKLFSNDIKPLRMLRQFGLGMVERMGPLKEAFVREAAGMTGEMPKLLRGELA